MNTMEILDRLEIIHNTDFFTDLRKLVLDDNHYALFRLVASQSHSYLFEGLRKLNDTENFQEDCFSRGQLQSKIWLINELKNTNKDLGVVFLCAGWYATLATLLFESGISINKIRSFDIDDSCRVIAETFNKPWVLEDWKFKPATYDIRHIDYNHFKYNVIRSNGSICELEDSPDTIINTSCEHIEDFKGWYDQIPSGKLVCLQSNDYFEIEDHINCVNTLDEFSNQTPMSTCLYQGELELTKYTRFMRIGYK